MLGGGGAAPLKVLLFHLKGFAECENTLPSHSGHPQHGSDLRRPGTAGNPCCAGQR